MLGLKTQNEAVAVGGLITTALYFRDKHNDALRAVSNVRDTKRQLKANGTKAEELAEFLSQHLGAGTLVSRADDYDVYKEEDGTIDMPAILAARQRRLEDFIALLRLVSSTAHLQATDDRHFRAARWIVEGSPESQSLWPNLFDIWTQAGKRVMTGGGPTYRFVAFVHQAANLAPPSPSTVRDGIKRWRKRKARKRTRL
jgi:hypothetical protein